jgi:AraC-like DNA-binding protein
MGYEKFADGKYFSYENDRRGKTVMTTQHYHNVFELYFLEEGTCNYFIDDKCYEVQQGDIILIPEGTIHKTMYDDGFHTRRLIQCSKHYIPSAVLDQLSSMLHLYRNPSISDEILKLLNLIEAEYNSADSLSGEIISNYVSLLFFMLVRNQSSRQHIESGSIYATQTVNYIKAHYGSDITLAEIAKLNSVSPEHLSRIFKKKTGFGFSEYLTMVRLQKAEQMLRSEKNKTIAKIAYECGFNDSNYFSEKFKRSYGISPIKYRKNQ